MIDFKKQLENPEIEKKINPIEIYDDLDRASTTGDLRSSQLVILNGWFSSRKIDKDLIIKLGTGSGKTLIGLLILQSKINEAKGRCLFVCPNKYLAEQTMAEAEKFGISACLITNDIHDSFLEGKKIGITHVQKVFNGKSNFGLGTDSIDIDTIILDDSHSCIESIQSSLTIRIPRDNSLYDNIFELFEDDLKEQGEGSLLDIKGGENNTILAIPYWSWFDKKSEILQLLSVSTDDFIQFGRNLIKDDLESFQAFITSSYIEISPIISPIDSFGSFANANQRILMSATTHNDAFVIKGLGFTKSSVENPLIDDTQVRSGEKMIIIPSLINEEIDRTDMLNMICGPGRPNSFGIVSLTPSFRKANDYKTFGCKIAESSDIHQHISSLKSGNYKDVIVFANRYDGIDLPDKSCQILVLDGIPYFNTLSDQYEENCRSQSDIVNTKLAQKVEQGLGRSVRGEKDFSAIIILGKNLIKFLKSPLTRDYFSLQTRKQIEIGLRIAELGKNEGSVGTIRDLLNQCIKRNEAWKEFYKTEMNKITVLTNQNEISDLIEREYQASCLYKIGNKEGAIGIIQSIIDSCSNDEDKGWYLQILARYTYNMSKVDSIELQKAAFQKNQHLLKPKNGIQYKKLSFIDGSRVDSIKKRISTYTSHKELMVEVDGILDNLSFGMQSEKFEEAMKRTGEILGFASQRPDKEFGKGPDNLWKTSDNRYFMIECKNEVLDSRKSIRKTEAGQMNSHCGWFESEYGKDFFVKRILCIPVKKLSQEGNFTHEVEVMRKGMLRKLKLNILGFFKEFKKYSLTTLSNQQIQDAIDINNLGIDDLVSNYSEAWSR